MYTLYFLADSTLSKCPALHDFSIIMKDGLGLIHTFCLSFALCLMILAIIRNYQQFGKQIGIDFIASLLLSLMLIFIFKPICKSINYACVSFAEGQEGSYTHVNRGNKDGKKYASFSDELLSYSTTYLIASPDAASSYERRALEIGQERKKIFADKSLTAEKKRAEVAKLDV